MVPKVVWNNNNNVHISRNSRVLLKARSNLHNDGAVEFLEHNLLKDDIKQAFNRFEIAGPANSRRGT